MSEFACRPTAGLKPPDSSLSPEVLDWVSELRTIWAATGMTLNRFSRLHPIDKGTLSRYLNGQRVPRDRWFLDKILAMQAENGTPVTPAVREHLTSSHLRALQTAHPHEYRVRMVSDELEIALTGKVEAERYARSLERQLAERNRQVQELTDDKRRLRATWAADEGTMQTDYHRLAREIAELTGQLNAARERAAQAELRCQQLEELLDELDAHSAADEDKVRNRRPATGAPRRRELQAALHDAIAHGSFTLLYQPIVTLTTGELDGFEAFARWPHPQWGTMRPSQFMTLAEETGEIVPLGAWALRQAATDMLGWRRRLGSQAPHYVGVNISVRQFGEHGFADTVRRTLDTCGLQPSALMLELTETVPLPLAEEIRRNLTDLKAIGVSLAVDNYGTMSSSPSALRELPVDVLKIDRSLFDTTGAHEQHPGHLQAIIETAGALQIKVIAEGIESVDQRDLLVSLGCQYGQGYFLAMPQEADQAEAFVTHRPQIDF
jgi:EAL domain-containing protein (putative c-di-GMP-specific phosphodiesterase class I)